MSLSTKAIAGMAAFDDDDPCAEDSDDPSWVEALGTNHADRSAAAEGCLRLLRAHLETGAHWIGDPQRLAEARASVGLSDNTHG